MLKKMTYSFLALVFGLGLSARAQTIVWISETNADANLVYFDQGWIDLLEAAGYTVDFRPGEWTDLDDDKLATLEAADLIIGSRNSNSGNYATDATEVAQWNSITTPLIMMTAYWCRNNRWLWINDTNINEYSPEAMMQVVDGSHPVFDGVQRAGGLVDVIDETVDLGQNSFILTNDVGNGTLIAQREDNQAVWIAEWEAGVEFYDGSGQIAGGKRMLFLAGGGGAQTAGSFNLNDDGAIIFLNAVKYMSGAGARFKAYGSNPADGTTIGDTWINLSWAPGDLAVSHDVYLGDNLDDVNDGVGDTFLGNQDDVFYVAGFPGYAYPDGLVPGTTYYWRIDEVNDAEPNSPWKGDIWSFSIPPKTAYEPVPADGAELIPVDATLTWSAGFGAKLHYMYFGEDYDTVNNATEGAPLGIASYSPGPLQLAKTYYWRIDEFDVAGTYKGEVWSFTTEGAGSGPNPSNGAVDVKPTVVLSWDAGDVAASHEVYFGTDADAVANATKTSPEYKGPKALGEESYDPGKLALTTTYYWRIDEVNGASTDSPWAGNVWSFTTGEFFVIDDFEDYDAGDNQIWYSWHDGLGYGTPGTANYFAGNGTGAAVGDETTASYTEETIVQGGSKSMPVAYDNNKQGYAYYSQVDLTLTGQRDWTEEGMTELSLWFYGNSNNSAEPLYVAVSNNAGTPAVVVHDDPAAATIDTWTEWVIPLQNFADQGINLSNVDKIAIGLGTQGNMTTPGGSGKMYFDDIRLYR